MKKLAILISLALLAACTPKTVEQTSTGVTVKPVKDQQPEIFSNVTYPDGTTFLSRPDVQRYIDRKVATGQFSRAEMEAFFANVQNKPNIIGIMDKPGTSRPWYEFRKNNVAGSRITGGVKYWAVNDYAVTQASRMYGVPPEVLVAIVGIETNYGSNMGSFRTADALVTLAFNYPRRAEFFRKELDEFMLMAHEERQDMFTFKGSYAGAMGMPQFMPSSYRKWAVDANHDGHRNIWSDSNDVMASVANYMKQHGWKTGGKISVPVSFQMTEAIQAKLDEDTQLTHTVGDFKRLGVQVSDASVADSEKAFLYRLETAPGQYDYYLGLNNFYAIWQYNHSRLYVSAVKEIAENVARSR